MFRSKRMKQDTPLIPSQRNELGQEQTTRRNDSQEDDLLLTKGTSLKEYRHLERRAEWRIRQAYFQRYGHAPGPTIFQV